LIIKIELTFQWKM